MSFGNDDDKILCLFEEKQFLEMIHILGHDSSFKTQYENPITGDFDIGPHYLIPSGDGTSRYEVIYNMLHEAKKTLSDEDKSICLEPTDTLDLFSFEKAEICDISYKSVLCAYKTKQGFIGISTEGLRKNTLEVGPIVWLSGPMEETGYNTSVAKRHQIFASLFDEVKKLEPIFGRTAIGPDYD